MTDKKPVPPSLAQFALEQLAEAGEPTAFDLTMQGIELLRAENDRLRAGLAALKYQPSAGVALPANLVSHRGSWIAALERLAVMEPEAAPGEVDDKAYWLHELQAMRDMYADLDRLNHRRAQSVPEGYVMVPVEPTPEMIAAVARYDREYFQPSWVGTWREFLAAAPSAKKES